MCRCGHSIGWHSSIDASCYEEKCPCIGWNNWYSYFIWEHADHLKSKAKRKKEKNARNAKG